MELLKLFWTLKLQRTCFFISKSCGPWNYFPMASWMWRYTFFEAHKCFWLHTTTHSRANALCCLSFSSKTSQNVQDTKTSSMEMLKHPTTSKMVMVVTGSGHDSWCSRVSCILTMILKSLPLDPWHPSIQSHHEPRNDVATSPFRAT